VERKEMGGHRASRDGLNISLVSAGVHLRVWNFLRGIRDLVGQMNDAVEA
jgi:hypothetical protein